MSQDDDPLHKDGRPKGLPTGDYEIGYAKPPEATKFKAGGPNPSKGRRKGSKNQSYVKPVLDGKINLTLGGKRRRIPAGQAVMHAALADALKGPGPARREMARLIVNSEKSGPGAPDALTPEEQQQRDEKKKELASEVVKALTALANLKYLGLLVPMEDGGVRLDDWVREQAERRRAEAHPPTIGAMHPKESKEPPE